MEDNVIYLENYKMLLELQKQYEEGTITEDEMTIEQIDALYKLYLFQIKNLRETLNKKSIQKGKE